MKKFLFGLDTLLRHRRNIEEKERNALARLNFNLQSEMRKNAEIEQRRMDTLNEMAQLGGPGSTEEDLSLFYPFLNRLRYESEHTRRNMVRLEKELQSQRDVVMAASREKKVIDRLKAKKESEYAAEAGKHEQKVLDEAAIYRFARRSTR